ncbi:hypothetical protein [Bacillus licheniformis]|uniref:hypothetical protein n=1 Tax=Bacillus licheniformis TaxID=1402 RepID=UPI002E238F98|nr:hypothetical protein [Bacillus licheniformis]
MNYERQLSEVNQRIDSLKQLKNQVATEMYEKGETRELAQKFHEYSRELEIMKAHKRFYEGGR